MKKTLAIIFFIINSISPKNDIENCPKIPTNNLEEMFAEEQKQVVKKVLFMLQYLQKRVKI